MPVTIFFEALLLIKSYLPWSRTTVSIDISSIHPFILFTIQFDEAPEINLTETVDFILLLNGKLQQALKGRHRL